MVGAGPVLLAAALALELYGIGASLYGARSGRTRWADSGRRAVYAVAILLTLAFGILELAFLRSDFSVKVVAAHSSTTTPAFYRAAAAWSAQEGSLLLWVWLLSLWSSLMLFLSRRVMRELAAYAQAVLLVFAAFFTGLALFLADPFATQSPAPVEGVGLSPLLRHPSMMIHPPMLYSGYTLFAVPFAFAVGALVTRRLDAQWVRSIRRFALAAWLLLGLGVLLGARWSYAELGWGGYWGWDPVENASLMPWLTGTALLHSIQVQEKRGTLKAWNASLALATGILAVLGTFLVRSGILDSIHAFGASTLGGPFLVFIGALLLGSVVLVASRRADLRSPARLDSLVSRETAFLLNNLVLVGLCFVIFWGTFFPLISEAVTGTKASVGPPWFDRYTTPLALLLVVLSGIGPALAWGRTSRSRLPRLFAFPLAAALLPLAGLGAAGELGRHPLETAMFCAAAFALGSVAQELWRGTRARRELSGEPVAVALVSLLRRNRRRYGGYLVHVGFVLLLVGVAASSAFQHAQDVRLVPGQTARVGGYDVRYLAPTSSLDAAKVSLGAVLDVSSKGRHVATLSPSRDYYTSLDEQQFGRIGRFFEGDSTSELGLRSGVGRDIWTAVQPDLTPVARYIRDANRRFPDANAALEGFLVKTIVTRYVRSAPAAQFRLIVSPLVAWIWIGGVIVVGGAMVAIWPAPSVARRRAAVIARSPVASRAE
ncbi:MAG: cytochrome c-type biosis protein CcmF [Solirubrobacteraceae bacterium]|nr:cytochrome c-type biosis protein CcmF [Solirubrobacteraceae bacterium]